MIPRFVVIIGGVALLVLLLLAVGGSPIAIVPKGEVGVKTRFGAVVPGQYQPGLVIKVPLIEQINLVDTRILSTSDEASASSKDLQDVSTKVAVEYSLNGELADEMLNNVGDIIIIIGNAIEESVKATTAKYTAEELITRRVEVKSGIRKAIEAYISTTLDGKNLKGLVAVRNVAITNFKFSPEFTQSIEAKVKAEQDALRAENEKRKRITQAEAAAKEETLKADAAAYKTRVESTERAAAIAREGKALRDNPGLVQLRLAEKWDGVLPRFTGGATPLLNLGDALGAPKVR